MNKNKADTPEIPTVIDVKMPDPISINGKDVTDFQFVRAPTGNDLGNFTMMDLLDGRTRALMSVTPKIIQPYIPPKVIKDQGPANIMALTMAYNAFFEGVDRGNARELGASTSFSALQASQGQEFLAMAGFDPDAIVASMRSVLELAKAGRIEIGTASDISSDVGSAFGIEKTAEGMGRLSDVFVGVTTRANTNVEMLGETMKYAAPFAKAFGASLEVTSAMAGVMTDNGVKGSQAGTALSATFAKLASPPKEAADALKQLGVVTRDAKGNMLPIVDSMTLQKIMSSNKSVEIFYTIMIKSVLAFLQKADVAAVQKRLKHLHIDADQFNFSEEPLSNGEWLGAAEKIIFDQFKHCAHFVSPFSIHNPQGWRYWLIHFSNSYRARQVYNNILHENSSQQAHFGRAGLNMLSYNPKNEKASLYLFQEENRQEAVEQLHDDIPRLVSENGDNIRAEDFYLSIYNNTPAHTDDIHKAMIINSDIQVLTKNGGERRKANTITVEDTILLKKTNEL